jgi:RNA polymerase sigma-70 factor (ECF subfamily)
MQGAHGLTHLDISEPWGPPAPLEDHTPDHDQAWLEAFRRGDARVMEACYRQHRDAVVASLGTLLGVADRETVVQEVFLRLLTEPEMRRGYRGPSLGAWLSAIARNRALDVARRGRREHLAPRPVEPTPWSDGNTDEETGKRLLLERFRKRHLPPAWAPVFETRFIREMTQREAARHLGMRRTTLAYRERCLRHKLRELMQG